MRQGRKSGLQKALRDIIANGGITTAEFLDLLEARGFWRLDPTELFMLCKDHRIAELDNATGLWRDLGQAVSERVHPGESRQGLEDSQESIKTSAALRRELQGLRERVVVPVAAPDAVINPVASGWDDMATAARAALVLERNEAVSRSGWQNIELIDGEVLEETPTRRIVRYEIQGSENVREGTTATLLPPEHQGLRHNAVDAEVLTQYGSDITLGVSADAPFWEQARLRCDLSYLVNKQVARFVELLARPIPGFDSAAAMQPVSSAGLLDVVPWIEPHPVAGLNEKQRLAVAHGMCPRLTWLWGPPGTGKTTTLAALLAELLDAGKVVLLAAPTNAAIDVALSALLKRRPPVTSGEVVRIGPTDNPFLTGRTPAVLLDEIAAAQGAEPARRLVEARDELAKLRESHHAISNGDVSRRLERVALTRKIDELEGFAKGLVALLREVRDQVIGRGRLLACTSHQVVLKEAVRRKDFDVVVIDEASMMTAAMTMLVAGVGVGHTIVAGDFRQLSPIVQAQEPEAREWLGQSAFEKSGLTRAVRTGHAPANLVALDTQHRMRPRIGDSIGQAFYPEVGLGTSASVRARPARTVPDGHPETILIDTTDLRAPLARREGMSSRYNVMHAQLAANVVSERLRIAAQPASIGLISPFAPQARLLESLVPEHDSRVLASTVHRFQGGETDVVLYDAVESGGGNFELHSWFTETTAGSEGARLLNVAMSRAREQAIMLADMGRIHRGRPPQSTPTRAFLQQFDRHAHRWTWREVAEASGPTRIERDTATLIDDIAAATENIEIFSARVDGAATRLVLEVLADIPDKVKIGFWFGPAGIGSEVERALRDHHTTLHPLKRCRESLVVTDSVVWAARAPILGRDPELLLRTDHSALAQAVRRLSLRRNARGIPGTGQHAERCACGSLRIRVETAGGPRAGVYSECRSCRS